MRAFRPTTTLTPIAAVVGAMATLACCLPWGIGAALGALGLSVFIAKFQAGFIVLSMVLLGVNLIQILRRGRSCRRRSRVEIAIWGVAVAIVLAVVLLPEWVASLLAGHHL
jgi:hypothetical protein